MSPQFVDFNADGFVDIVAGTYDGSPYIAYGSKDGFKVPTGILDRSGARIVQNAFWNYDTSKWDTTTRCNPEGDQEDGSHGTSAIAVDWDSDGDLDLLLGDYKEGRLYLRRNDGKQGDAKFIEKNESVTAEAKPLVVSTGISTVRICDWNGDGLFDLLIGSMGDCWGEAPGGGVDVWLNVGKAGAPTFKNPTMLVPRSQKGARSPTRPDAGLYMDIGDPDGDGDLDLIVGGYSMWTPSARALSNEEKAHADALKKEIDALQTDMQKLYADMTKSVEGLPEKEKEAKLEEVQKKISPQLADISEKIQQKRDTYEKLVPGQQRESFTWFYERIGP